MEYERSCGVKNHRLYGVADSVEGTSTMSHLQCFFFFLFVRINAGTSQENGGVHDQSVGGSVVSLSLSTRDRAHSSS